MIVEYFRLTPINCWILAQFAEPLCGWSSRAWGWRCERQSTQFAIAHASVSGLRADAAE